LGDPAAFFAAFIARDRFMGRKSSFVELSLGLCLAMAARAEGPAAIPAAIPPATTERVQQTVDRAIGYLQTESAA
jgi:hypothetical protein